ncbi:hypothetical protein GCM10010149_15810 [Nonomuraea roseoviolacea subsp. roseoviolacea]|uniref:NAD(P)/FAD-dependent oxidoreductase n=1 Tax=Nonomuraea roseoviolacea TaxID=103837 RepID=UPI0031D17B24
MRVTVIGSGIVGASAAYHLSSHGADVVVVDADLDGQATAAGAGIVCPWVDHPDDDAWYALARSGARHYPELMEALGEDLGYEQVGALLVAEDPAELEPVRALLERRYAGAPEMGEVSVVPDPARLFPPLAEGLTAVHVPGAARVDGRAVRDALLRAAVRQGAELRTGVATLTARGEVLLSSGDGSVTSGALPGPDAGGGDGSWRQAAPVAGGQSGTRADAWEPEERRAAPEERGAALEERGAALEERGAVGKDRAAEGATGEKVAADMVVVAAGAWSGAVCRPLGVEIPVFPRRGQIVHAVLDGADTAGWPIVLPHVGPYLLGFPGSRVVVGATVEDVGFVPRVTMGGLEEVLRAGLRLAPGLAGATVTETRVGLRPVRAGGPPLMCRAGERVVVATGLSAYGLTAGPYAGLLAARLALGEPAPLDLAPYRLPS